MSGLVNRLKALARDPKARAVIERARQEAAKPENRRRLEQLTERAKRRR